MSRTHHARKSKTERQTARRHDGLSSYNEDKVLATIAKESKTATEFTRRAEAWNSSNARQLSDRALAEAYRSIYQRATDLNHRTAMSNLEQLVRMARETRLAARVKLWNKLARDLNTEVES